MTEFAQVPLKQIASSPTNPRKTFNEAKLQELAASISESGVHQAVLLRPLPGSRVPETAKAVKYELVCGERRLRASVLAQQPTIPAMIRELTDGQVLEIQIVENLQRDDLTPLEEAEGYKSLHTSLGDRVALSADDIAKRIGKSRRYVYNRMKLLDTSPEVQDALRTGQIDASKCLELAKLLRHSDQIKALRFATTLFNGETPSVRELTREINRTYLLRLADADFDTKAEGLAGQPSCDVCDKRSDKGAADLFDTYEGPALCLDKECWQAKSGAKLQALRDAHQAKGEIYKTFEEAQEEDLINWMGKDDLAIRLGQVREDLPEPHTDKTIKQLLGKHLQDMQVYAIEEQPGEDDTPSSAPPALWVLKTDVAAAFEKLGISVENQQATFYKNDKPETQESNLDGEHYIDDSKARQRSKTVIAKAIAVAPHITTEHITQPIIMRSLARSMAQDFYQSETDFLAMALGFDELAQSQEEELDIDTYIEQLADSELPSLLAIMVVAKSVILNNPQAWQQEAAQSALNAFGIERSDIEASLKTTDIASAFAVPPPSKPAKPSKQKSKAKAATRAFQKGDRVTVNADCSIEKRASKTGKLSSPTEGGLSWWVNFGGKNGSDILHTSEFTLAA